ncbi:hypothetical protein [Halodesulfovibrio sp.]|jgi:hypothetical protein|uniref:hypothetical protein n=1 Tax=Halodesulfovibrio sp. TaxID=1912772 RepID=UPI0025F60144|nr:hypothetical protein [Halodesulfovibrio sp.]MCT4534112.1 hypothetical protein [Halodesulfovibrio sp.]
MCDLKTHACFPQPIISDRLPKADHAILSSITCKFDSIIKLTNTLIKDYLYRKEAAVVSKKQFLSH